MRSAPSPRRCKILAKADDLAWIVDAEHRMVGQIANLTTNQ